VGGLYILISFPAKNGFIISALLLYSFISRSFVGSSMTKASFRPVKIPLKILPLTYLSRGTPAFCIFSSRSCSDLFAKFHPESSNDSFFI